MYIVGYIDDENDVMADYIKRLARRDIEMKIAPKGDMESIKKWIVKEHVECMMIDYQLSGTYGFVGTELFSYLNDELPGLPCMILTSYTDSSVQENKVVQNCIFDRSKMDRTGEEFEQFCEIIKQSSEVFKYNLSKYKQKYEMLYQKRTDGSIRPEEEEELLSVFKILRAYGEVDDISSQLLTTKVSATLDSVLEKLDDLLKK
ncbi:MAG: chemotaxis protein [Lachnospiraceae bacterium]|nr:chemotaxis protein [Lachnospiraceae bacterium]